MGIITRMRRQNAIYWALATEDGYGGQTYTAPVEIECRWDDLVENFITAEGEETISNSIVAVDRVVTMGGFLKLGDLDSTIPTSPVGEDDAYPIRQIRQTPNLRNTETLIEAIL